MKRKYLEEVEEEIVEKKNRFMESFGLNSCNRSQIVFFFNQFPHFPSVLARQILDFGFDFGRDSDQVLRCRRRRDQTRKLPITLQNHRRSGPNASPAPPYEAAGRRSRRREEVRWNSGVIWEQMDHSWNRSSESRFSLRWNLLQFGFSGFYLFIYYYYMSNFFILFLIFILRWYSEKLEDKVWVPSGWNFLVVGSHKI